MRTLKLTIAYDGANYAGWQCQPDKPTVQETLENAIEKVTGRRGRTLASGRTDAGVHALGQVVGFRTDSTLSPEVFLRALNANLPHDIAVLDVAEVANNFHPIRDAHRKRYRYIIHDGPVRDVFLRHYAWHYVYGRLDVNAMRRAAAPLLGKHDFRSFESSGAPRKSSVRTVFDLTVDRGRAGQDESLPSPACGKEDASPRTNGPCILPSPACGRGAGGEGGRGLNRSGIISPCPDSPHPNPLPVGEGMNSQGRGADNFITIEIEADGFLYNMVRAIVGTLVQVGRGAQPESWPAEVLNALDRRAAGPTAPPEGLFLVSVDYTGKEKEH